MKITKVAQAYLYQNLKDIVGKCCKDVLFKHECCEPTKTWKAYAKNSSGALENITHKLTVQHTAILDYFKKSEEINLTDKVLNFTCCSGKKTFFISDPPPVGLRVSGHVWNDINGMSNGYIDNSALLIPSRPLIPSGLKIYLIKDTVGGVLEKRVNIKPGNGEYSFSGLEENTDYILFLTPISYPLGTLYSTIPPRNPFMDRWIHTGQSYVGSPTGEDGFKSDGAVYFSTTNVDIDSINFGVRERAIGDIATV